MMVTLDVPGMIKSAVHFVRIQEENSTFSTERLRAWFIRQGHCEYRNEQGGITSVQGGGITYLMKRLAEKGTIEGTRDQHWRGVTKMPKTIKELKDHITEDEALLCSAFFLMRNPDFEPRKLSGHLNELGYGSYAGAVKKKGCHFSINVVLKFLKENNMAQEKQDTVGTIWISNLENASKFYRARVVK